MNYKQLQTDFMITLDNAIDPFYDAWMQVQSKHPETTRILRQIIEALLSQYFIASQKLQEVD